MIEINKKLTMLTYLGETKAINNPEIKNNIEAIYAINNSGLGFVSFSSTSLFNSLSLLQTNNTYLIDSKLDSLPWSISNSLTTTNPPESTTPEPTTTTAEPTTTTAEPTTTTAEPTTTTAEPTTTTGPGTFSLYATQSNAQPDAVSANSIGVGSAGDIGNFANYANAAQWNGILGNTTTVGTNGGPSHYGTFDQSGNIWEWNDSIIQNIYRGIRGGAYNTSTSQVSDLSSTSRKFAIPTSGVVNYGFRLCTQYPVPANNTLIEFIPIESSNIADTTGFGSISYNYCISKYPITNQQYSQFLLAIAQTDSYGVYNISMTTNVRGGINSNFSTKNNMANKPVNYITWFMAARFANWLHNSMTNGQQTSLTTENGAYTLNGATSGVNVTKNPNALYWIPTEDEWYKAAYYRVI